MKICVAQARPVTGNVPANIERHKELIGLAISNGAGIVIFPELSLTGYEPALAKNLATDGYDSRFEILQEISDADNIIIGAGMPIKNGAGPSIGMLVFQPNQERSIYFKKYLHPDEDPFFISGENLQAIIVDNNKVAFGICYEISIAEHVEMAAEKNATVYIASVAKFKKGVAAALERLSTIAKHYSMTVLMSNAVGKADDGECAGSSAIWNHKGELREKLDESGEGILLVDLDSGEVKKIQLQ